MCTMSFAWKHHVCLVKNFRFITHLNCHTFQGEEYKLFWPEQSEFVRMAARFGATIIPFGVVGEDDISQVSVRTSIFVGTFSCHRLLINL